MIIGKNSVQSESDMYGKVLYRALYSGCPIGQSTNEKGVSVLSCSNILPPGYEPWES